MAKADRLKPRRGERRSEPQHRWPEAVETPQVLNDIAPQAMGTAGRLRRSETPVILSALETPWRRFLHSLSLQIPCRHPELAKDLGAARLDVTNATQMNRAAFWRLSRSAG